jgi:hypothetical protein
MVQTTLALVLRHAEQRARDNHQLSFLCGLSHEANFHVESPYNPFSKPMIIMNRPTDGPIASGVLASATSRTS